MSSFEVDAIVEIPFGSMYKYEVDKSTGTLRLDRPLPCPIAYSYGYVPNTLHPDGDPLDVCILSDYDLVPLVKVKLNIIGALICNDNGYSDDKLLGVLVGEDHYSEDINDFVESVRHYLSTYKTGFVVEKQVGPDEALEILMKDVSSYQNS